jgi:hypothetical protein
MPAFTFEKISPPIPHGGATAPAQSNEIATVKKPPGVIVQIFGRLVETRVDRAQRVEQGIAARREQPSKQG